jgi:hypothetical protein
VFAPTQGLGAVGIVSLIPNGGTGIPIGAIQDAAEATPVMSETIVINKSAWDIASSKDGREARLQG